MKERPIIFSEPMVRAILAGKKTQTRRLIRGVTSQHTDPHQFMPGQGSSRHEVLFASPTPPNPPHACVTVSDRTGDRLWVRETWSHDAPDLETCRIAHEDITPGISYGPYYRASECAPDTLKWISPIHMPRWASRITLEITEVGVQRVQDLSEKDAWTEGIDVVDGLIDDAAIRRAARAAGCSHEDAKATFGALWDEINGKRAPWASNPWVWAISFKRLEAA